MAVNGQLEHYFQVLGCDVEEEIIIGVDNESNIADPFLPVQCTTSFSSNQPCELGTVKDSNAPMDGGIQPKRPMNSFMCFRREFVLNMPKTAGKKTTVQQWSRLASAEWKKMNAFEKKKYEEDAARQKEEHSRNYPDYKYRPQKRATKTKSNGGYQPFNKKSKPNQIHKCRRPSLQDSPIAPNRAHHRRSQSHQGTTSDRSLISTTNPQTLWSADPSSASSQRLFYEASSPQHPENTDVLREWLTVDNVSGLENVTLHDFLDGTLVPELMSPSALSSSSSDMSTDNQLFDMSWNDVITNAPNFADRKGTADDAMNEAIAASSAFGEWDNTSQPWYSEWVLAGKDNTNSTLHTASSRSGIPVQMALDTQVNQSSGSSKTPPWDGTHHDLGVHADRRQTWSLATGSSFSYDGSSDGRCEAFNTTGVNGMRLDSNFDFGISSPNELDAYVATYYSPQSDGSDILSDRLRMP